jgi:transposase
MSGPAALQIVLRRRVRRSLVAITRSGRAPYARVVRARIVLLAAERHSNAEIARRVGCEPKTVRKWRARFAWRPQVASLNDDMRVGRPPTVPTPIRLELIKLACSRPGDCKAPFREVWSGESLRAALQRMTGFKMSTSEVRRILRSEEIRPHRLRVWLHSPDPEFAKRFGASAPCT